MHVICLLCGVAFSKMGSIVVITHEVNILMVDNTEEGRDSYWITPKGRCTRERRDLLCANAQYFAFDV